MARFKLSRRASIDLGEIADYTIDRFGIQQARRYRDGLDSCFLSLAKKPLQGRRAHELNPELRRLEHEAHVIFYVPDKHGVLIVRVLHRGMDFQKHFDETGND